MYNKLELIWLENKVFLLIYQMLEHLEEKQKVTTKAKRSKLNSITILPDRFFTPL